MHSSTVTSVLDFELIQLRGVSVTVGGLITAIVIIVIGWWISTIIQRGMRRAWSKHRPSHGKNVGALLRLGHYTVMLIAIGIALETLGINLTTLFAAGAIFAIGIGFAMQNVAQNFVSGVILLFERSIRPGDLLEVEGIVVRVEQLGMRATLVRTRFEEEMIVPNATLVQSTIKNFTLHDSLFRIRTAVGVAYESDLKIVFATLQATAKKIQGRVQGKDPVVLLTGFGASSVDFEISVWTDDPWGERVLVSQLNDAIWWALKTVDVSIAFPQTDVHLDPGIVDALRSLATASVAGRNDRVDHSVDGSTTADGPDQLASSSALSPASANNEVDR